MQWQFRFVAPVALYLIFPDAELSGYRANVFELNTSGNFDV